MVFGTYYSGIAGTDKIVGEWITKGNLGEVCGINCYKSQNVNRHTTGHFTTGATPLIDSTTATGASTLKVDGFTTTTNTVKKGDIFTLGTAGGSSATAPLYATNPMSGDSNSYLRQFAVGGDLTSTGSGDMVAVAISPKCQYAATDPFTTVSQLPIDEHNLTFLGTQDTAYAQNLVFCKDAFGLVCLDHERPDEGVGWIETDPDSGLSIRIWKVWDWATNRHICRCDCLYGVATFYPELAVRVWGK